MRDIRPQLWSMAAILVGIIIWSAIGKLIYVRLALWFGW